MIGTSKTKPAAEQECSAPVGGGAGPDLAVAAKGLLFSHQGGAFMPALEALDFTLERGGLLCLAGINGSGKSTLLALLAGLYACRAERFMVLGHNMAADEAERRKGAAKTALLMQDPDAQILGATVEEDLLLGLEASRLNLERARDLARRLGLERLMDLPCQHLSHGQKRKLCLASALMRQADLLLLDEPFSGLDYPAIKELRAIIGLLKRSGRSLVVGTHDLEPLLDMAEELLVLSTDGRNVFGPPEEVLPKAAR
ncbi:energy-coupling factor ABC transporter ATP-binding protein, partial [Desulfovibrio sp. OttesenSCG-928-G11]|nr:energy-coupling factor ABC transporter ATP-binding protein [Desulfovibrio sp. OttesenSCG-928-G11]